MQLRKIIRSIQTGYYQDQWYGTATNAALFMAIGGFLDEANRLLYELWKYKLPHDRNTWLYDRAFEILWYEAGKRPGYVPFSREDIDKLELSHRDYLASPLHLYQYDKIDFDKQSSFVKGRTLATIVNGHYPDKNTEEKALNYLKAYLNSDEEPAGYISHEAFALAAELAARNDKKELAVELTKRWALSEPNGPDNITLSLIGGNRHLSPLLLKGIIAEELGLTKNLCEKYINEITTAIDDRMINGPSLIFGDLNWKELLYKLSDLSIRREPEMFSKEQIEKKYIGFDPASKELIEKTEKRLGLVLPEAYKAFLSVTNGLSRSMNIDPGLVPVEEVDFLKNASIIAYGSDEILEITKTFSGNEGEDFPALVESAIAISRLPDETEIWLMPPQADNLEWECWEFIAGGGIGEYRHKNFRYYIESQIQFLEYYYLETE